MGFELSKSMKLTIDLDVSITVDADPKGNGVAPVLNDKNGKPDVDFAVLISGSVGPSFEFVSVGLDGTARQVRIKAYQTSRVLACTFDISPTLFLAFVHFRAP